MKLYFQENEENCAPLSWHRQFMKEEALTELKLFEAKVEYGTGFMFCTKDGECGRVGDCGRVCDNYQPRNGKNGRCRFSGHVYESTDKIKILKLKS